MDLADWRARIDAIDRDLVRLLNERVRCVAEIGRIKLQNGLPVDAAGREEKVYENLRSANQGPLGDDAVRRVFERIVEEGKVLQRQLRGEKESEPRP
jgi:chorismate mutase